MSVTSGVTSFGTPLTPSRPRPSAPLAAALALALGCAPQPLPPAAQTSYATVADPARELPRPQPPSSSSAAVPEAAAPIALEGALSVADIYERASTPGQEVTLKGLVRGVLDCCDQHGEVGNPCERQCAHRHIWVVDAPRAPRFLVLLASASGPPELKSGGYYGFRATVPEARDDLPRYSSGGREAPVLEYRAHNQATAPTTVLAPTYDDGSWSVSDLSKRFDLMAPEQLKVTGYVLTAYVCPPCPPKAVCKPCAPPYLVVADTPQRSDGLGVMIHTEQDPPKWRVKVGQRYVFTGTLRDDVHLSMTFQAQAPAPEKPPAR